MTKEEIIKAIVRDVKDYRFTHDELMKMSKEELIKFYPQFANPLKDFPSYPLSIVADLLAESQPRPLFFSNDNTKNNIIVDGRVSTFDNGKIRIHTELLDGELGLKLGDKVRIIIVKEDAL